MFMSRNQLPPQADSSGAKPGSTQAGTAIESLPSRGAAPNWPGYGNLAGSRDMNSPAAGDSQPTGQPQPEQSIQSLHDSEAQFRALIEKNADGVVVLRPNGVICYANPAAVELLGRSCGELTGQMFGVPVVPGAVTEVNLLKRGCGTACIAEMRVTSIHWQGELACLATLRDVTERRNAESSAREAVRLRDRFLALLSHELRNPLSAIGNAAALLSKEGVQGQSGTNATRVIDRQVAQMSRLLDDLLDVARVTEGKITLKNDTVELREAVEDALEAILPQIQQQQHQLIIELGPEPVYVNGDPARLQQIFANLLANAAKYTPACGEITVSVRCDDDACEISVADNGLGLTQDETESIFEMFMQSDDTIDRSEGGLGLGLTLARDLVTLHNGEITAHSAGPGTGCEFVVRLPRIEVTPEVECEPQAASNIKRVLVVEDIDDNRNMLKQLLEFDGYEVETAADGKQALEAIRRSPPDIALMDIGLPEISGYDVAREIRRNPLYANVVLIALTGYGRTSDRQATRDAGFNAHLVKPFNPVEFQRVLASV